MSSEPVNPLPGNSTGLMIQWDEFQDLFTLQNFIIVVAALQVIQSLTMVLGAGFSSALVTWYQAQCQFIPEMPSCQPHFYNKNVLEPRNEVVSILLEYGPYAILDPLLLHGVYQGDADEVKLWWNVMLGFIGVKGIQPAFENTAEVLSFPTFPKFPWPKPKNELKPIASNWEIIQLWIVYEYYKSLLKCDGNPSNTTTTTARPRPNTDHDFINFVE